MKLHVLVVGGAGYIGSHTVKALKQAGHAVTIFDLHHPPAVLEAQACQGSILNTADLDTVFSRHAFDAVIHFAAFIEVGESVKDPGNYFWNNTAGTLNLLNVMLKHKVYQLVFSSTAAVYGTTETVPIPEDAPKAPTSPYGTSKWLVEQALADFCRCTPLKATILRYFNACGADVKGELGEAHQPESHLIPLVLQVALGQRESIKIFGDDYPTPDGTAVRDYIHVVDLADAHVKALEGQGEAGLKTYNVGTGKGYSVKEVVQMCRTVTGHAIPAETVDRRSGDPAELVADSHNIQTDLSWQPQHSDLTTIVETAWAWHKQKS